MKLFPLGTAALLLAVLLPSPSTAAPKEPITHEAIWLMNRVQRPIPSPDGKWVVFSMTEPSYDEKKQVTDLWIVPADASAKPRRLTSTSGGESDARWSNDSRRIAFAAKRGDDEVNQIYVLDTLGGEAQRVTNAPQAARLPKFSPDGTRLAFISAAYPTAADEEATRKLVKEKKDLKSNVRIYDSFPIRRWDKWLDETQTHLFVTTLVENGKDLKSRDLLAGTKLIQSGFAGRSSEGSSEDLDVEWTPDGKSLLFVATTQQKQSAYATVPMHLWRVSADGGEPVRISNTDDSYSRPKFRPDGKGLCFSISADANKYYALDRLACMSWPATGAVTPLTASFDRSVGGWDFSPDSKFIYFTAESEGHENIYRVSTAGGETSPVMEATSGVYTGLAIPQRASTTTLFANWGSSINPNEIFRIDPATRKSTALTTFTVARAASLDWEAPRRFSFKNSKGRTIQNYLIVPQNFDPAKKYPIFSLIHGGAANMWRDAITLRWNYHLIASPGYVVLLTDYTGSTGYGEAFTQALIGDPLKGPAEDVNEAVDEAIKRFPFIDGTRQAAGGASYGGHIANWLEGTTTRYKFLVSHAGLANLASQWGTSDAIYHRELTAQGPVWEQSAVWREQNPVRNAANFKTPMLLSVGEKDYRVPLNNTLEMWSYLQRMKVPSRLMVWPDENHWILSGENSKVFYRELHDWFKRWM